MKIPFTKYILEIKKYSGGSISNGNGYTHTTISLSLRKILGDGDDGTRGIGIKELYKHNN